jgi:hypothetical protein
MKKVFSVEKAGKLAEIWDKIYGLLVSGGY